MASKPTKKLRADSDSSTILQNKVHDLIQYIENSFADEGRIKERFATAALTGALRFLDEISRKEGVAREIKIDLLAQIARAATDTAHKLSSNAAARPTALWSDRGTDKRFLSPCDWVKEHWPTYGRDLILSDIRDADRPLYRALIYHKREHGWPSDFKILTKEQHNSQLLKQAGGRVDLRNIEELPSEVRRQRRRLLAAQRYRAGKPSPAR